VQEIGPRLLDPSPLLAPALLRLVGEIENANAERFVERLDAHRSPEQREKYRRYFKLGEGE
jgi:hypothetical protein